MPFFAPFNLGEQEQFGSGLEAAVAKLKSSFPGLTGLTSFAGAPGRVSALGFSHPGPLLFPGQQPSSLSTLISAPPIIGSTQAAPESITSALAQGSPLAFLGGGGGGAPGAVGSGVSGATAGVPEGVTNPAGALGITGPTLSLGPLGTVNPVQAIANQAIRGVSVQGFSPVGSLQGLGVVGQTISDALNVSPQMDPNVAAQMNFATALGLGYGVNTASGVGSNLGTPPSFTTDALGNITFSSPVSTMGGATGLSSTGVGFGGPGQSPNISGPGPFGGINDVGPSTSAPGPTGPGGLGDPEGVADAAAAAAAAAASGGAGGSDGK